MTAGERIATLRDVAVTAVDRRAAALIRFACISAENRPARAARTFGDLVADLRAMGCNSVADAVAAACEVRP